MPLTKTVIYKQVLVEFVSEVTRGLCLQSLVRVEGKANKLSGDREQIKLFGAESEQNEIRL